MPGKFGQILVVLATLFPFLSYSSERTISLPDDNQVHSIGKEIYILEDPSSKLTIYEVSKSFDFKQSHQNTPLFGITKSAYWIKFHVKKNKQAEWYLELGNPVIDTVNFYYFNSDGSIHEIKSGEFDPVINKELHSHLYLFKLPLKENETKTFYLKVQSINSLQFPIKVGTLDAFFIKNNDQDIYHGIYYGFIILVLCFNIFFLYSTKDEAYLYYIFYIISIGLFIGHINGHAFTYVWSVLGWHRNLTIFLASSAAIFAMVFAANFLQTKKRHPVIHNGFYIFYTVFISANCIHLLNYRHLSSSIVLVASFLATLYVFAFSIYVFIKGYKPAKFFIMAFAVFAVGTIAFIIKNMDLLPYTIFTNYSIEIGSGIEIIFFSVALADKINIYKKEKEDTQKLFLESQQEIIRQLTEKEQLKDLLNKELEQKVLERTKELEEKNKQLDSFVYKASHDIKGPLKSVIGLTTIGIKDIKDPSALAYFDHIYNSTVRLDNLLTELLSFTKAKEHKVEKKLIDLNSIFKNVLSSFEHAPGYDHMNFTIDIDQPLDFLSDEKIVYSIIQNMVENGIKYRDPAKEKCILEIKVKVSDKQASFVFRDNGLGIDEISLPRIFDMFYKVNENSVGTGLGLYITKTSINKLGGSIVAESEKGIGTRFKIHLPNQK